MVDLPLSSGGLQIKQLKSTNAILQDAGSYIQCTDLPKHFLVSGKKRRNEAYPMYREALQIREILVAKISLLLPYLTFLELLFYLIFKNAVQTNGDGDSIFCPMVIKYSIITHHIMTKMLIYFVLPLWLSFSRYWQLKTSNFETNFTFPDGHRDTDTDIGWKKN